MTSSKTSKRGLRRGGVHHIIRRAVIFRSAIVVATSTILFQFVRCGEIYAPSQLTLSSPVYANAFEIWANPGPIRHSSSPVTFRVQCETRYGWEVISDILSWILAAHDIFCQGVRCGRLRIARVLGPSSGSSASYRSLAIPYMGGATGCSFLGAFTDCMLIIHVT